MLVKAYFHAMAFSERAKILLFTGETVAMKLERKIAAEYSGYQTLPSIERKKVRKEERKTQFLSCESLVPRVLLSV